MDIKQQIKEKEKMISDLQYEIYKLKSNYLDELTKSYQKYVGKYYKLDCHSYVKVIKINNDKNYSCIKTDYDDEWNCFTTEYDSNEMLYLLKQNGVEVTEEEFMKFINDSISKVINKDK